jgi:hypothetical protein
MAHRRELPYLTMTKVRNEGYFDVLEDLDCAQLCAAQQPIASVRMYGVVQAWEGEIMHHD